MAREERVAFIGISNWALDPAKMNRGIMVMRGDPGIDELVNSARYIVYIHMNHMFQWFTGFCELVCRVYDVSAEESALLTWMTQFEECWIHY